MPDQVGVARAGCAKGVNGGRAGKFASVVNENTLKKSMLVDIATASRWALAKSHAATRPSGQPWKPIHLHHSTMPRLSIIERRSRAAS